MRLYIYIFLSFHCEINKKNAFKSTLAVKLETTSTQHRSRKDMKNSNIKLEAALHPNRELFSLSLS